MSSKRALPQVSMLIHQCYELCNILGVETEILSITRLGKMLFNNIRPLRVCLGNEVNKLKVFTRSPQRRHNPKQKHVYVNCNMTTAQRESV